MHWASRAIGPTICSGTTLRTRSISLPIRPGTSLPRMPCRGDSPGIGIAMDMSIQLKSSTGAIGTLSLSFNNEGPLGTFFRYIGDTGTYIARYDDLFKSKQNQLDQQNQEEKIDVSRVDVRRTALNCKIANSSPRSKKAASQCEHGQGVALLSRAAPARTDHALSGDRPVSRHQVGRVRRYCRLLEHPDGSLDGDRTPRPQRPRPRHRRRSRNSLIATHVLG